MSRGSWALSALTLVFLAPPLAVCDGGGKQAQSAAPKATQAGSCCKKEAPASAPSKASQPSIDSYARELPRCVDPAKFATTFDKVFPGVTAIKTAGPSKVLFLFDTTPSDKDNKPVDLSQPKQQINTLLSKLENTCTPTGKTSYVYPDGQRGKLGDKTPPSTTALTQWKSAIPGVTDIIPAADGRLVFIIDKSPDAGAPAGPRNIEAVKKQIRQLVDVEYANLAVPFVIALPAGQTNAGTIATMLNGKVDNATVVASDNVRLLVTPAPADAAGDRLTTLRTQIQDLVNQLAGPPNGYSAPVISQVSRLFYYRDNKTVVDALNAVLPDVTAAAVDTDGIMLSSAMPESPGNGAGHERTLNALKQASRLIAHMDQPHAQVSLYAWSLQLSDKEPVESETRSERVEGDKRLQLINSTAAQFNGIVAASVGAGWSYLRNRVESGGAAGLDPVFAGYLRGEVGVNPGENEFATQVTYCCGEDGKASRTALKYGLGFGKLFSDLSPNLMNMLLVVSATSNPMQTANCLINHMEGREGSAAQDGTQAAPSCSEAAKTTQNFKKWANPCQASDQGGYDDGKKYFQMECTRELLQRLYTGEGNPELGRFRATIADFLFQYKLMTEYPDDFDAYLEPYSASKLDAQLVDYVDAFETDLAVLNYTLRDNVAQILKCNKKKSESYDYSGIVSVKVVAGKQALVESKTQNYFPATPPNTLADFAKALSAAEASQPKILTGNLSGDAATFALAALAQVTPPKQTVSIGRELDMTVTPYTLSAANGAELDIEITAKDNGASVVAANTTGGGTPPDDLASRIAAHHVLSHVRLQSLKLFELSSMDSALARSKQPWKPFDPYLEIPAIGELVRIPRHPDLIRQRGVVFISAVVVPTAADLAATPIEEDYFTGGPLAGSGRSVHSLTSAQLHEVKRYHASVLRCLAHTTTRVDGAASGCTQQTLDQLFAEEK